MKKCSFSGVVGGACHQVTYTKGNRRMRVPSEEEKIVLSIRTTIPQERIETICCHHEELLMTKYSTMRRRCCDPLKSHPEVNRSKGLYTISWAFHNKVKSVAELAVPGEKLCPKCRIDCDKLASQSSSSAREATSMPTVQRQDSSSLEELDPSSSMVSSKSMDTCWVPSEDILCPIQCRFNPILRYYQLGEGEEKNIQDQQEKRHQH